MLQPQPPPVEPNGRRAARYVINKTNHKNSWWLAEGEEYPPAPEDIDDYLFIPVPEEDVERASLTTPFELYRFIKVDDSGNISVDVQSDEAVAQFKRMNLKLFGIIDQRNIEIQKTDWTQLADVYHDDVTRSKWNNYRRQLRDLPQTGILYNERFQPYQVNWPTPPQ